MASRNRTHLTDALVDRLPGPRHLEMQEFGRRLYSLALAKGWRQSELARQADMSRDSVSTYVRGVTFPSHHNLVKLARALDVTPESLLPNHTEAAIEADIPSIEMKVSASAPGKAWVRVNRLVSTATAVKIINLVQQDATSGIPDAAD